MQTIALKARQHLQEIKESKLGLFNDQRIPTAWMAVLDHYLLQDRGNLQDFQIPQDRNPAPRMTLDITRVDATIGQLKGTEPEMEDVIRQLLTGLESQKRRYIHLCRRQWHLCEHGSLQACKRAACRAKTRKSQPSSE